MRDYRFILVPSNTCTSHMCRLLFVHPLFDFCCFTSTVTGATYYIHSPGNAATGFPAIRVTEYVNRNTI